jgi:hypothetical protein
MTGKILAAEFPGPASFLAVFLRVTPKGLFPQTAKAVILAVIKPQE